MGWKYCLLKLKNNFTIPIFYLKKCLPCFALRVLNTLINLQLDKLEYSQKKSDILCRKVKAFQAWKDKHWITGSMRQMSGNYLAVPGSNSNKFPASPFLPSELIYSFPSGEKHIPSGCGIISLSMN